MEACAFGVDVGDPERSIEVLEWAYPLKARESCLPLCIPCLVRWPTQGHSGLEDRTLHLESEDDSSEPRSVASRPWASLIPLTDFSFPGSSELS